MKYIGLCRKCKIARGEKISSLASECVEIGNCEICGRKNIELHFSYVPNKWRGLTKRARRRGESSRYMYQELLKEWLKGPYNEEYGERTMSILENLKNFARWLDTALGESSASDSESNIQLNPGDWFQIGEFRYWVCNCTEDVSFINSSESSQCPWCETLRPNKSDLSQVSPSRG